MAGRARGAGGDALRPRRRMRAASRWSRRPIRCPMPPASGAARRILDAGRRRRAGRSGAVPDLGRRLVAARPCRRRGCRSTDKQAVNRALLASGADIGQMNVVRKHLSAIKGGRLAAAAHPAQGREPLDLRRAGRRSGGDRLRADRAGPLDLRRRAGDPRALPASSRRRAVARASRARPPTRRRSPAIRASPRPRRSSSPGRRPRSRRRAARARSAASTAVILGDAIEGEAREVAKVMAGDRAPGAPPWPAGGAALRAALGRRDHGDRARPRPRRAQRRVPAGARACSSTARAGISALAADTDGIDGSEDNAGALLTPDTLARARGARAGRQARCSPTTTATASSARSATWS